MRPPPPWPDHTVTQARSIVRDVANCVRVNEKGLGQTAAVAADTSFSYRLLSSSSPENFLLALDEADAEGGLLMGGVTSRGRGIYRHVLSSLDAALEARIGRAAAALTDPLIGLKRAHYMCGLARILLGDSPRT